MISLPKNKAIPGHVERLTAHLLSPRFVLETRSSEAQPSGRANKARAGLRCRLLELKVGHALTSPFLCGIKGTFRRPRMCTLAVSPAFYFLRTFACIMHSTQFRRLICLFLRPREAIPGSWELVHFWKPHGGDCNPAGHRGA